MSLGNAGSAAESIQVGQMSIRYLIDGAATRGLGVFELDVPPNAMTPPPHSHTANEECIYVLDGVLRYGVESNWGEKSLPEAQALIPKSQHWSPWQRAALYELLARPFTQPIASFEPGITHVAPELSTPLNGFGSPPETAPMWPRGFRRRRQTVTRWRNSIWA